MSVTVASLILNMDSYVGDTSTDVISQAERFEFLTEAVKWVQEETQNDLQNTTYSFNYFDTVNTYKITASVPDILDIVDLVRATDEYEDHTFPFTRTAPRDIKVDIANGFTQSEYAIERRDNNWYLLVNHESKYPKLQISSFESLTGDGGTWQADTVNSDATNVTIDEQSFIDGVASLNFDVTVAQSGNNRATIYNSGHDSIDLSDYTNLGYFIANIDIPVITNFTSVTFYWGTDSSNYYSVTVTTDINGNAFIVGTNTLKWAWSSYTKVGTPDDTDMTYFRFDFNYGAGYTNTTDFRIDNLRLVRPESLSLIYTTWTVGTSTGGTNIYAFTATTDIPYFSGKYDQLKYAVAHKAAALALRKMRLYAEGNEEEKEAGEAVAKAMDIIPSSVMTESRTFKVRGVNFKRRRR